MATITKTAAGTFKVQVRRIGLPAVSKTFKTKHDAEVWSRSVESEQDRGVFVNRSEADRVTVGELMDRYIVEVTPLKRSAKNDKQRLLFLKRHFGHFIVSQLQSRHIAAYRDKRLSEGRQGATVVKEIGSLRHLLDVAIKDWGVPLVSNAATLVRKPKQSRGRDRRLAEGEERRLLDACKSSKSPLLAPLVTLALETGMRLGEMLVLEWKHVDLTRQTAYLPLTKNGEARVVPLSKRAAQTLQSLPRHIQSPRVFWAWAKADSFENVWRRAVCRAGIEDLRFHDLRHEATSRLFEKGLNVMEVASVTGHKTLQMLKRYTHLRAADLIDRLG
jgi:integrase